MTVGFGNQPSNTPVRLAPALCVGSKGNCWPPADSHVASSSANTAPAHTHLRICIKKSSHKKIREGLLCAGNLSLAYAITVVWRRGPRYRRGSPPSPCPCLCSAAHSL